MNIELCCLGMVRDAVAVRNHSTATLTEQACPFKYRLYDTKNTNFFCGKKRVIPNLQGSTMLPARVANRTPQNLVQLALLTFFFWSCSLCEASSSGRKRAPLLVILFLIFLHLFIDILSLIVLQDIHDKNHLKGDFMFHTEHVVELVAKLLVQAESQHDMSASVHVSDR